MISQKYLRIKIEYLNCFFGLIMIAWQWIDRRLYYYVDRSNGSSIVWWWFENRDFFGGGWNFCQLLRSIDCWWLGKRWVGFFWACGKTILGELKTLADKKALKKSTIICVEDRTYVGNTKGKRAILIWNWGKQNKN